MPVINCITLSHLPFRSIFYHACINSSTSYAAVGVFITFLEVSLYWYDIITFVIPWECPGPLALVLFSTTASMIAQQPTCTVFTVASTWVALPVQLMGPMKLNPTSLAFPKGSPSLCDCHPKIRIASLGTSTTALVICSSRPSWNISAINKPLQAWKGVGWSPPPSPRVTPIWMQ